MMRLHGVRCIITPALPGPEPTLAEDTIRMVRHGLANVLEWLGEDVGPKPGSRTHIIIASDAGNNPTVFVSQALHDQLKAEATYAC